MLEVLDQLPQRQQVELLQQVDDLRELAGRDVIFCKSDDGEEAIEFEEDRFWGGLSNAAGSSWNIPEELGDAAQPRLPLQTDGRALAGEGGPVPGVVRLVLAARAVDVDPHE